MLRFLFRRSAQGALIVWIVATTAFVLLHLAPGDPVRASLDSPLVPESVRAYWVGRLGLDRPLPEQYVRYLAAAARGDLGFSFPHRRGVGAVLADAIPNTLLLMGVALALSFAIGIAVGVFQARRHRSAFDRGIAVGSLVFYSMPDFWLALMMLLVFAYALRLFPVSGMHDAVMYPYLGPWARLADLARHLVLPAVTLTLLGAPAVARYQRAAMLDVGRADFVRTARAKGVGERRIAHRHVLRNALLPVITLLGLALPALLGGSVFVEKIFSWPGMGTLTVNAIATRDYPLLTAALIVASVMMVVGSLVADLLYALADPRVRIT
ncbi:MAG TPA: ABC transporter permease [Gemmatimonadaceae bacterium]